MIENLNKYPAAAALAIELMTRHQAILADAIASMRERDFDQWPEPINLQGWSVRGVKWQGKLLEGWDRHSIGRLSAISPMIVNAGYSLMAPGAKIAPHVGYTGDVLRMHLGLSVPKGDCAIVIDGYKQTWENGRVFMFDDTKKHEAYNKTTEPRLILLLDLNKKEMEKVKA